MKLRLTGMLIHSVALDTRQIQQPRTPETTGHNNHKMEF